MGIETNLTRTFNIWTENYTSYVDLTGLQYCAVAPQAAATGKVQATTPGGQGVMCLGILQNVPNEDEQAEVMKIGRTKGKSYTTFNSGVELTPHDGTGRLEAAGSGDYIVAMSVEAATCANAIVTVDVIPAYQKN